MYPELRWKSNMTIAVSGIQVKAKWNILSQIVLKYLI